MSNIGGTSADAGMVRVMGIVGFALLMLALCIALTANILGGDDEAEGDKVMRNALIQRIEPVGRVRTSADDLPKAEAVAVADAGGAQRSGEELVQGACAACHAAGVANAPLLDDEEAWAERREAGLDALVASVTNGKGSMPARGGSDYSDDEIKRAVQHIALFEVEEEPAAEEPAAEAPAADASAEDASEEGPAEAADAAVPEKPAADASAEAPAADAPAAEGPAADEAAPDEAVAKAPAADASTAAVPAAVVVGQAPDNMADHVKGTVDGLCAGCHIAGVANAPKIGDVAAWQERADAGMEALTASVINGKGVMPARGGSNLTDEEIPIAIQYLMSK